MSNHRSNRKSPYDVLGVPNDAKPEEIKRAYRKSAKSNHPDQGGSAEAMHESTEAYRLLSDKTRREKFDKTGSFDDDPGTDNEKIYGMFFEFVNKLFLESENVPIKENLNNFKNNLKNHEIGEKSKIAQRRKIIELAKKRLLKTPENDLIGTFLNQKLAEIEDMEENLKEMVRLNEAALALFDGYSFDDKIILQTMKSYGGMFFNGQVIINTTSGT